MTGINKIPIENNWPRKSNNINACALSSVTSYKGKQCLNYSFKDALPRIMINLSRKDFQKKRVCYVLKKGIDLNACKACTYSIKDTFASKTIRIIKPFLNKKKESHGDVKIHMPNISAHEENTEPIEVVQEKAEPPGKNVEPIKVVQEKAEPPGKNVRKKQFSREEVADNLLWSSQETGKLRLLLRKSNLKPIEVEQKKTKPPGKNMSVTNDSPYERGNSEAARQKPQFLNESLNVTRSRKKKFIQEMFGMNLTEKQEQIIKNNVDIDRAVTECLEVTK